MRIGLIQSNPTVGDLSGNAARILAQYRQLCAQGAELVLTPELALTGYPLDDLLTWPDFLRSLAHTTDQLAAAAGSVPLIVGTPRRRADGSLSNAALLMVDGQVRQHYEKRALPNYGVFDELRHFRPGAEPCVLALAGMRVQITICEDIWDERVRGSLPACDLLLNLSASPYEHGKQARRERHMAEALAVTGAAYGVYCNLSGGQDELVFDGASFVTAAPDAVVVRLPVTVEGSQIVDTQVRPVALAPAAEAIDYAAVHAVLVTGLRDYVRKSGFMQVMLGMSGGIDSALVAALACDAVGADNVLCVSLPSRYNSPETRADAERQSQQLGAQFVELAVEDSVQAALSAARARTGEQPLRHLAGENLQSRMRGTVLMLMSNHENRLLLATGNKSEYSVGYATLYGDTNGAYAPIKDLYKTEVYALCDFINRSGERMLKSIIDRPPTAELREGQRDDQSLPPYPVLDAFLQRWIDERRPLAECCFPGFDAMAARRWALAIQRAEYKRRQAAPGPKLSANAFGRERRLPIANGFDYHA